jgi:hypothetical protein
MSRRTTLGPMSPSQINSRSTGLAGRVGVKEPKTAAKPTNGRLSLLPSALMSVDRRSSAYGKASGVKQDPRPLGDKNYFQACLRTVITYLSSNSYPHAVSPKTLTTPTAKDFANIVQFLFQRFDPTMKALGKIEDEVTLFFKRLNYPFQISKSALFAVGSPHSWPAVLAALTWLVELLNYEEKAEQAQPSNFDDKQRAERDFYGYVSASYRWAHGRLHGWGRVARVVARPFLRAAAGAAPPAPACPTRHRGHCAGKLVAQLQRALAAVAAASITLAPAAAARSMPLHAPTRGPNPPTSRPSRPCNHPPPWGRYFLAGDDHKCQAADEEMLSQFKQREVQVLEEVQRLKEVRRGGGGRGGRGRGGRVCCGRVSAAKFEEAPRGRCQGTRAACPRSSAEQLAGSCAGHRRALCGDSPHPHPAAPRAPAGQRSAAG